MADDTASMIDMLANEYKWSVEYCMSLPLDQAAQLTHSILYRRGVRVFWKLPDQDRSQPSLSDRVAAIFSKIDKQD